jgi:hypothetical protein
MWLIAGSVWHDCACLWKSPADPNASDCVQIIVARGP